MTPRPAVLASLLGLVCACSGPSSDQQVLDVYVPPPPAEGGVDAGVAPGTDAGPSPLVDRAGHPLVTVMLVPSQLDDAYNAAPSFSPGIPRTLEDAIEARLTELDTLALGDGGPDPVDWPIADGGAHPLLPAFVADTLLVDTSLSCLDEDGGFAGTYFDLDREVYLADAAPHSTCGGRTPGEDVVSETLTLLVTGGRTPVSQGVSGPTKPASVTFPYLAPPN